jgi:cell division topological specificity factor
MAAWRSKGGRSANDAKERLKLVLIHDRTDLTPKAVDQMKNELMEVISRYIAIDPEAVRIDVTQDGREQRLVADIPIKSSTRRKVG